MALDAASYHWSIALAALPDGTVLVGASSEVSAFERPLTLWKLRADGELETGFGDEGAFRLAGRGRATAAQWIDDKLVIGGYMATPAHGSHMVFLQFAP